MMMMMVDTFLICNPCVGLFILWAVLAGWLVIQIEWLVPMHTVVDFTLLHRQQSASQMILYSSSGVQCVCDLVTIVAY